MSTNQNNEPITNKTTIMGFPAEWTRIPPFGDNQRFDIVNLTIDGDLVVRLHGREDCDGDHGFWVEHEGDTLISWMTTTPHYDWAWKMALASFSAFLSQVLKDAVDEKRKEAKQ